MTPVLTFLWALDAITSSSQFILISIHLKWRWCHFRPFSYLLSFCCNSSFQESKPWLKMKLSVTTEEEHEGQNEMRWERESCYSSHHTCYSTWILSQQKFSPVFPTLTMRRRKNERRGKKKMRSMTISNEHLCEKKEQSSLTLLFYQGMDGEIQHPAHKTE